LFEVELRPNTSMRDRRTEDRLQEIEEQPKYYAGGFSPADCRRVGKVDAPVDWDFVVLFGTVMFWALLHIWSPDGRQWRHDRTRASGPSGASLEPDSAPAPPSVPR
jgi:hypothetical protein